MNFEEKRKYHTIGKVFGFTVFVIIFSVTLTIVSRITRLPDLIYLTSLAITLSIMLLGSILGEILK